jgi:hypothetical protein
MSIHTSGSEEKRGVLTHTHKHINFCHLPAHKQGQVKHNHHQRQNIAHCSKMCCCAFLSARHTPFFGLCGTRSCTYHCVLSVAAEMSTSTAIMLSFFNGSNNSKRGTTNTTNKSQGNHHSKLWEHHH